ncbi:MAG TPA: fibronectin type III domain-containing protein [Elusimicrobiota bacterium]|nr:fibronectin type III domain-containing protein [Elusimicrobiota bacterium]
MKDVIKRRILALTSLVMVMQGITLPMMSVTASAATSDSLSITIQLKDVFPPQPIADLLAAGTTNPGEAQLLWTAPYEDDLAVPSPGAVTQYVVRYATFSAASLGMDTTAWWNLATDAVGEPATQPPGNTQGWLMTGLTPGVTLWFSIRSYDDAVPSNFSDIDSKTSGGTQASAYIYTTTYPQAPTLSADSITTTQIRWILTDNATNETGLAFCQTASSTTRVVAYGALAGTGLSENNIETPLSVNTAYTRYAEAFNAYGSSFSASLTRYTLANPPTASQVLGISTTNISLGWNENGNPANTLYEIQYSTVSSFAGAGTTSSASTSTILSGLRPNTTYWIHVRAYNGDGVPTAYDVTISTRTNPALDTLAPKPPHGIWPELHKPQGAQSEVIIHWRAVTKNVDDTLATDVAGYNLYKTDNRRIDDQHPLSFVTSTTGLFASDTIDNNRSYYYVIRTYDSVGNLSPNSMMIEVKANGTELNLVYSGAPETDDDGGMSSIIVPASMAKSMLTEYNDVGEDLVIDVRDITSDEKGRVIESEQFIVKKADSNETVNNFAFNPPVTTIMLGYNIHNGQVIQGAPGATSAPVVDAAKAANELSLFWFNGVEWIKVGATVDTVNQTVSTKSGRVGRYQIRHAIRVGPVLLTAVYPKVITPNDDGWNDKVIFQFQNDPMLPLKGEIFDTTGAKVGDLVDGPQQDTLVWDGKRDGKSVPSGIYIYQIEVGGETVTGTVVVSK